MGSYSFLIIQKHFFPRLFWLFLVSCVSIYIYFRMSFSVSVLLSHTLLMGVKIHVHVLLLVTVWKWRCIPHCMRSQSSNTVVVIMSWRVQEGTWLGDNVVLLFCYEIPNSKFNMTTKQIIINTFLCTLGKAWDLQTKKTKTKAKQSKTETVTGGWCSQLLYWKIQCP